MNAPVAIPRTRVRVRGLVQGVGFRPFVVRLARRHGLTGWVRNDEQGVLLEVQGAYDDFLVELYEEQPPLARIDAVEAEPISPQPSEHGFTIDASAREGRASSAIGADHAPCLACL
jgi:hydrogenase maturation protein HypF